MKVLQVHNFYQIRGGEATVVEQEKSLLEAKGHEVITWYRDNAEIEQWSHWQKLKLVTETTWSSSSAKVFEDFLTTHQPDICHVHNFFPLISPSIYEVCNRHQVPVVQTLHNYRLVCTNGILFRNGAPCETCVGKSAYKSVLKACYRNSALQTYTVARMLEKNKRRGTWSNRVDAYICLTDFAKSKFIAHGLPAEKLYVKPNFLTVETRHEPTVDEEPYFVFAGRLSDEKGVRLLANLVASSPLPIKVFGDGPQRELLENLPNITCYGKVPHHELLSQLSGARALLFPSQWYEGMPMTIIEAFSVGVPVIANRLGAMETIIEHEKNGFLIQPNNLAGWLEKMQALTEESLAKELGKNARLEFEEKYTKFANYKQLMSIYQKAMKNQ